MKLNKNLKSYYGNVAAGNILSYIIFNDEKYLEVAIINFAMINLLDSPYKLIQN